MNRPKKTLIKTSLCTHFKLFFNEIEFTFCLNLSITETLQVKLASKRIT